MKGIELIEQYPKASEVVLAWYKNKMKDSLNISTLSEDIKESFSDYIVGLDHISIMIDNNPRFLFDVLDENKIYIFIHYMDVKDNVEFFYSFRNIDTNPVKLFETRKEAELAAMEQAFKLLDL